MLSILNEEAAEQMKSHFVNILRIFQKILLESSDLKACFHVISSLKSMIPFTNEVEAVYLDFNSHIFKILIFTVYFYRLE
jgi:hypothetical protein